MLIPDTSGVDGNDANGAGHLGGTKEPAAAFPELLQIQLQAATHTAYVAGLQVGVNKILKIGCAIFSRHFKERQIFRILPNKIFSDIVSRDRESKSAPFGVARDHHINKGLIN